MDMKKISLKSISRNEVLTREELKQIIGGTFGSGGVPPSYTCVATCKDQREVTCYAYSSGGGCSGSDNVGCVGHDRYGVQYFISC